MQLTTENRFWQYDIDYWFRQLNSSEQGLSKALVDKILLKKGLHPKCESVFKNDFLLLINQFKSSLKPAFDGIQ